MKNILKFSTFLLLVAVFWSCEEDDNVANTDLGAIPTQVNVSLQMVSDASTVSENGGTVNFEVSLENSLPIDIDITLDVTSSDGSNETTSGIPEFTLTEGVITSGTTSVIITATFVDDTIMDITETYTFSLANAQFSSSNSDYYITSNPSTSSQVTVIDELDPTITTIVGDVSIVLDWAGFEDLDLYLRDEPGFDGGAGNIDFSWYSQPEEMTIDATLSDGEYFIGFNDFSGSPSVPCDLTLTFPDGQELQVADEATADVVWIPITKITVGDEVWYFIN